METNRSNITEDVPHLDPEGRLWIEKKLGRPLDENERVFIMTATVPDAATRQRLWEQFTRIQQDIADYQEAQGISPEEVDKSIDEAMERVRPRKRA
jgi:hypothetical protein